MLSCLVTCVTIPYLAYTSCRFWFSNEADVEDNYIHCWPLYWVRLPEYDPFSFFQYRT